MGVNKAEMGLLTKLLAGVFVPVVVGFCLLGGMVFFSWDAGPVAFTSIRDLGADSVTQVKNFLLLESGTSMRKLVENQIREKASSMAGQIALFRHLRSDAGIEEMADILFGETVESRRRDENIGTAVYDIRGNNLFHVNPAFKGVNLHDLFRGNPEMLRLIEGGFKNATSGYYDWKDKEGKGTPKYICFTPVKGTDLVVAVDSAIEELAKPAGSIERRVGQIEEKYLKQYEKKFKIFFLTALMVVVMVMGVIYLNSRTLIHPIRQLSEVADRISMGDLDAPIEVKAKGEVAMLAQSIVRMQTSVREAINRLRRERT